MFAKKKEAAAAAAAQASINTKAKIIIAESLKELENKYDLAYT